MKLKMFVRKYVGLVTIGLLFDIIGAGMVTFSLITTEIPGHYYNSRQTGKLSIAYISYSNKYLLIVGFLFLVVGFCLLFADEIRNRHKKSTANQ